VFRLARDRGHSSSIARCFGHLCPLQWSPLSITIPPTGGRRETSVTINLRPPPPTTQPTPYHHQPRPKHHNSSSTIAEHHHTTLLASASRANTRALALRAPRHQATSHGCSPIPPTTNMTQLPQRPGKLSRRHRAPDMDSTIEATVKTTFSIPSNKRRVITMAADILPKTPTGSSEHGFSTKGPGHRAGPWASSSFAASCSP
jgi:hypothetical protein